MSERNGPGEMKTESRSPMITSGVATPSVASNNIAVVITTAATNPASNPARIAFVLLIAISMSCRGACAKRLPVRRLAQTPLQRIQFCRGKNFSCALQDHFRRDLFHAGVIERALAQPTIIAGRTRQVDTHNRLRSLVRP